MSLKKGSKQMWHLIIISESAHNQIACDDRMTLSNSSDVTQKPSRTKASIYSQFDYYTIHLIDTSFDRDLLCPTFVPVVFKAIVWPYHQYWPIMGAYDNKSNGPHEWVHYLYIVIPSKVYTGNSVTQLIYLSASGESMTTARFVCLLSSDIRSD